MYSLSTGRMLFIDKVKSCRGNKCKSANTTFKKCRAIHIIYNIKRKCLQRMYQNIAIPNTKLKKRREKGCEKLFIRQNLRMTNRAGSWKHAILQAGKKNWAEGTFLLALHHALLFMSLPQSCLPRWVFPDTFSLRWSQLPASSAREVFALS